MGLPGSHLVCLVMLALLRAFLNGDATVPETVAGVRVWLSSVHLTGMPLLCVP